MRQRYTQSWLFVLGHLLASSLLTAADKPLTVVMLGDSTTLCQESKAGSKLPELVQAQLAEKLKLTSNVINAGKGADTAKGGLERLPTDVLAHDPDVVTISFGLNDVGHLKPEEYQDYLEKIVAELQAKSRARILLITSTPFNNATHVWGPGYADKGGLDEHLDANYCKRMRDVAKKQKVPLADLHELYAQEFKRTPGSINQAILPDGCHLSDAANQVSANALAPLIGKLLKDRKLVKK
jgi:lysophospholipase L1-like esterase